MQGFSSTDPSEVGPLSRKVLEYGRITKRIVENDAKQPGFTVEDWADLAALVDIERFERVGNFMEVVSWPEYAALLTRWAPGAKWDATFKRITEVGNLVFQELEERSAHSTFNSVSVYDFGDDGLIRHLDIYLQSKPADTKTAEKGGWAKAST